MLSKKLFRWLNHIALFAIVFASLAPSISHALAAQSGVGFAQEVCTTTGKKITIQVLTTKGQQLATDLSSKPTNKAPAEIGHHLQHCPFCANPNTDAALETPNVASITVLETAVQHISFNTQTVLPRSLALTPPAQAPPAL